MFRATAANGIAAINRNLITWNKAELTTTGCDTDVLLALRYNVDLQNVD
jgi:hypothetical protein